MYSKRYNHFMGCKTTILAPTPVHDFPHLLDLLSTARDLLPRHVRYKENPWRLRSRFPVFLLRPPSFVFPPPNCSPGIGPLSKLRRVHARPSSPFLAAGGAKSTTTHRVQPRLVIAHVVRMCSDAFLFEHARANDEGRGESQEIAPHHQVWHFDRAVSSYAQVSILRAKVPTWMFLRWEYCFGFLFLWFFEDK